MKINYNNIVRVGFWLIIFCVSCSNWSLVYILTTDPLFYRNIIKTIGAVIMTVCSMRLTFIIVLSYLVCVIIVASYIL